MIPALEQKRCGGSTLVALAAAALLPFGGMAQTDGLLVFDVPTSAAAAALGNAHPMFGSADNAIFMHPGLLAEGSGFGAFFADLNDETLQFAASASGPWWNGGVAVGVQVLTYFSAGTLAPTPSDEASVDRATATESVVAVGYAREILGSVRVGVVGKLVEVRTGTADDRLPAFDVGGATEVGPVALALSIQGLGPDPDLVTTSASVDPRVSLGAATGRRPLGPLDISAAAALVRESDGNFGPGGGVELSWWPVIGRRFIGRIGLRRIGESRSERALTLGGGFEGDDIALEYAFQDVEGSGGVHRFGVRWR